MNNFNYQIMIVSLTTKSDFPKVTKKVILIIISPNQTSNKIYFRFEIYEPCNLNFYCLNKWSFLRVTYMLVDHVNVL